MAAGWALPALLILLAACGQPGTSQRPLEGGLQNPLVQATLTEGQPLGCRPDLPVSPPSIDWDQPPSGGVFVSSAQEAATHLAFVPREPQGLGSPGFIWVSGSSDRNSKAVRFNYELDMYGIVQVAMWLDPVSLEQRSKANHELVARNGDPCIRGEAEIVAVRGGVEALLGFPPEESRAAIGWREGPVMISVSGPTLKRDDAIAIAEGL